MNKNKRIILIQLFIAAVCTTYPVKAQDGTVSPPVSNSENTRPAYSNSYYVLGRDLTGKEKEATGGNLTKQEITNTILPNEQKLVIVRALIATGSSADIKRILDVYSPSGLKTFEELVYFFNGLKEKYGSVKIGIESKFVFNITDDQEAFKKAAAKAYENVFGIPEEKQEKDKIINFLIQNNALTYSKMVSVLIFSMTPDMKKQLLFNVLEEVGRPDLKNNKQFVDKLLAQELTYESLISLLREVAPIQKGNPTKK